MDAQLEDYIQRRDRILETEDMDGFVSLLQDSDAVTGLHPLPSPEVALAAFHKARYEATSVTPLKRMVSGEWLRNQGMGRFNGLPLLPPGELPE